MIPVNLYLRPSLRLIKQVSLATASRNALDQVSYIKSVIGKNEYNWLNIKNNVLSMQGTINEKNFEGVLLRIITSSKKFDVGLAFASHLLNSNEELSLGSINGLLGLYYSFGKETKLKEEEKKFILDSYEKLYDKYKSLDFSTCEKLLHALCVINEWEKALKVLDDILLSSEPTHSAYNILIATIFNNNKKDKALQLIQRCISNKRSLRFEAYEAWISYILRNYKNRKVIIKHLNEICLIISSNCFVIDLNTAIKFKDVYTTLGWNANLTRIKKHDGQCMSCKNTLDLLSLSKDEFNSLKEVIQDKLIVGSDLFLKTSPTELRTFLKFIEHNAPFDVVLDGLNIAYAANNVPGIEKVTVLNNVVDYFRSRNKKVLLLSRKHMRQWRGKGIEKLLHNTCNFFTDNVSQDDPYFITAAIMSGSHTDIVSKDLLRGHTFLLKNEKLSRIFRRWQWQHQWMIYFKKRSGLIIQPPLTFTPCAQNKGDMWHLPYETDEEQTPSQINDGIPDLSNWLCIQPKLIDVDLFKEYK
ncbi:hypothetical protein K1T71_008366 [Dendrolimus kikuchii]|uniref:Uncharacterized protein n=1 Tax=Dendrolimus kikuchii TaxID=765133 RepID=A0ACC1CX68_9NEOP|nr:hypothetical protein K1T71_008366 [Dendrolimus kikuchii]